MALLAFWGTAAADAQEWLAHVRGLDVGERSVEIKAVSQQPKAVQRARVPALIQLLDDEDQSMRVTVAAEIAEIHAVSSEALPKLIENFKREHGEEGMVYVAAVAAFGERALPRLQRALKSDHSLVRMRACDAVRKIKPKLYLDGECKHKAR